MRSSRTRTEPKQYEINVRVFQKQAETIKHLNSHEVKEILYGGGAGGGKSWLGCYWVLLGCILYPGSRWLIGRAKLKTLRETTYVTLTTQVAPRLPVTLEYNAKDNYIDVYGPWPDREPSRIILRDLFAYPKDPEFASLGSLEITGAFVDEATEITKKAYDVLKTRIRWRLDRYNLVPTILLTCNPEKGWIYNLFYKPWKDNELDPKRRFVKSLAKDNPFAERTYLEQLDEIEDPVLRRRLRDGDWEFDNREGVLVSYENACNVFANTSVMDGRERFISADIAEQGSDRFVVLVWYGFVVKDMRVAKKSTFADIEGTIKELERKHRVPRSNIVYDRDGVGGFLSSYLKHAKGFRNNGTPIYRQKRFKEDYQNLKSQCYFHLARKIQNHEIRFDIEGSAHEEEIIEELSSIRNASVGTDRKLAVLRKEKWKEELGRSPDFADAFMMRMYFDIVPPTRGPRKRN